MAVKKSIAIIGEGETEWWYFDTLRIACRYKFKVAPDFPQHSDIPHMAKLAEEYVKRDTDYVVCLVDMDRLLRVPAEMATYQKLKKKSSRNVIWIETNPCTEFWFIMIVARMCCPTCSGICPGTRRRHAISRRTICIST